MSLVDLGKRLLDAAKRGDTDEVRTLMSNGAPFTTDWLGTSPLHFAAQHGHAGTAEVLLRAGISRDARTKVDRTPLHVAAQEGHLEIVDLLLKNGADIEAKDMLKMTPLHWAVEKAHLPVIENLVKHGADIACENKFDKSPVEIAITNGRTDIAQILQIAQTTSVVEVSPVAEIVEEVTTTEIPGLHAGSTSGQQIVITSGEPVTVIPNSQSITSDSENSISSTVVTSVGGETTDQSSTSVLATLAALAEATAPLNAANANNPSASEALNWLETHGITMISAGDSDTSTIVTSQLESGQTLTLTEAGKLALNFVKHQGIEGDEDVQEVEEVEETELEHVVPVPEESEQKVIAIVADQETLGGGGDGGGGAILVEVEEEATETITDDADSGEPPAKKVAEHLAVTPLTAEEGDQDILRKQLEEMQKQAEAYKQQLREKEEEAATYKKQLTEISAKSTQ